MLRKSYLTPVFFFLFTFVIFNINLRAIPSGDTIPTSLLPFSIIIDHSITLDRFQGWYDKNYPFKQYFFITHKDHVYSNYPTVLPIIVTPLYVPVIFSLNIMDWPVNEIISFSSIMEKSVASLIASLSAVAFFLLLIKITSRGKAFLLTLIYAFGTETWSISSQALWQHGGSELMIIVSLFYLRLALEDQKRLNIILAGLFAGLSVAIRPADIFFLIASYGYILVSKRGKLHYFYYIIFPLIIGIIVISYNYLIFNNIFGGYSEHVGISPLIFNISKYPCQFLLFCFSFFLILVYILIWPRKSRTSINIIRKKSKVYYSLFAIVVILGVTAFKFNANGVNILSIWDSFLAGLIGVLISPSRGLFIYSPVFIFVLLGIYMRFRQGQIFSEPIFDVSLGFVVLHILLISRWFSWYGGYCYGPRMLTDIVPCLVILLIPGLSFIFRLPWLKTLFAVTFALSIAVQTVGVFCYEISQESWDGSPISVEADKSRLWDWKDNQIMRTISEGPKTEPYRKLLSDFYHN